MRAFLFIFIIYVNVTLAQNTCYNPYSLCTSVTFSATVNTSATAGPSYGCLTVQPNPTWFYTKVTGSGSLQYNISSLQNMDVDFICWGPFLNMNNICSQLTSTNIVDCSYSASSSETLAISNAIIGEYYLILVTNYSNQNQTINFNIGPGTGTACSEFEGITGSVYNDLNSNCLYDTTAVADLFLRNIPVKEYDNAGNFLGLSYQNDYGNFRIPYRFYNDTGAYLVKIDTVDVPYTAQCLYPGTDSVATLTTSSPIDTVNFNIMCKPGFDLRVHSLYRSGRVFPGLNHYLKIMAGDMTQQYYNLNCPTNVGGQVTVNFSGPVSYSYTSGAVQPSSITGSTITYTVADFSTVDIYNDLLLTLGTNTNAVIGDSVCVDVDIAAFVAGDNNPINNHRHYCYPVTNSYDPNMKETYPENVLPGYDDWFYYTIHFQNTGNASAHNISLTDTLSSYLDVSTFERINYSHNNNTSLVKNVLQFNFEDINLPDSTSNNSGSKGFVQYRVKPKTNLTAGTVIDNRAFIYFDYNPPIITNTSHNKYLMITGIKENTTNEFAIFPNPTSGVITVTTKTKEAFINIGVYNVVGDLVFESKTQQMKTTLDFSYLNNGVYFIKVGLAEGKIATYKMVIQK